MHTLLDNLSGWPQHPSSQISRKNQENQDQIQQNIKTFSQHIVLQSWRVQAAGRGGGGSGGTVSTPGGPWAQPV